MKLGPRPDRTTSEIRLISVASWVDATLIHPDHGLYWLHYPTCFSTI